MSNLKLNPQFVNATNSDFHIKATSPMISKGKNIVLNSPAYKTDIDNQSRIIGGIIDIGADEYKP